MTERRKLEPKVGTLLIRDEIIMLWSAYMALGLAHPPPPSLT